MSLAVNFYTFSKRINSTARPSTPELSVQAVLKDNSGVSEPVLEINMTNNPGNLNYAYIPQFSRYYYVNDWVWILGRWEVSLSVDVLATFRPTIGSTNKFVLRSAYEQNKAINDIFYPMLARKNIYKQEINTRFANIISNGIFVLGVVGTDGSGLYGAVTYYALYPAELLSLLNFIFPLYTGDFSTDVLTYTEQSIIRSVYDPFDYIVSCKWFPIYYGTPFESSGTLISFGNYQSNIRGYRLKNINSWDSGDFQVALPTNFVNLEAKYRTEPNCTITAHYEPWGIIELDSGEITTYSSIDVVVIPDYITGKAILRVYEGTATNKYKLLHESIANLGIPLTLAKQSVDISGFAQNAISGVFDAAKVASGQILNGGISALGNVIGAVSALFPKLSGISGSTGQFAGLDGIFTLIVEMPIYGNENPAEFGYALYANRTLGDIPGYIKCADGDITIGGAYKNEIEELSQYLTNGFYFE